MLHRFLPILLSISLLINTLFLLPSSVFAQSPQAWQSVPETGGRCVSKIDPEVATIQGMECVFYNVLQVIVIIAGLAFFIMFIVGGFQYLMSSNDQKAVAQASSTLTMAFIGVIGIILSWFALNFIATFTGLPILNFFIPGGN